MIARIQYTDSENRLSIIAGQVGKFLIVEENLFDGNFLTFTDSEPIEEIVADMQEAMDFLIMGGV